MEAGLLMRQGEATPEGRSNGSPERNSEGEGSGRPSGTSEWNQRIGRAGRWRQAFALFEEANGRRLSDLITYNTVMGLKQWKRSLCLLEAQHRIQMQVDVISFNASLSSCGEGNWEKALILKNEIKGSQLHPTVVTKSSVMKCCCKAAMWIQALDVWDELRAEHLVPNSICFTVAVSICEAAQRWLEALKFLKMMRESRCSPHVVTYSGAISACGKAEHWQHALFLLDEMKKLQLQATLPTFNSAIHACVVGNELETATKLLRQVQEAQIETNAITYTSLIGASEWHKAISLLSEAYREALAQDLGLYRAALGAMGEAREKSSEDAEEASRSRSHWLWSLLLFEKVSKMGLKPGRNTCNMMISSCGRGSWWSQALQVFSQMKTTREVQPDTKGYTTAIFACGDEDIGQWQAALVLMDEFHTSSLPADVHIYNTLMSVCAMSSEWDRALLVLDRLSGGTPPLGPDQSSFLIAVLACSNAGEWQQVLSMLNKASCKLPCN